LNDKHFVVEYLVFTDEWITGDGKQLKVLLGCVHPDKN
jgi:hypothetical protein